MAELTHFGYRPGTSRLHEMDVRLKMAGFAFCSLAVLGASAPALLLLTMALIASLFWLRLSLISVLLEIRYLSVLLLAVFIARSLSTEGTILWRISMITLTVEGVFQGGLVCWRLLLIVILGLVLVVSTRPSEIRAAVGWFLRPVPRIPENRVATMVGLMARSIPMILNQARETVDAQRARCIENRRNPVTRLIKFVLPLIRGCFKHADDLALAMIARGYDENRPLRTFLTPSAADWLSFGVVSGLAVLMLVV